MQLKVNFFATLRQIVGGKTVIFEVEECITARALLEQILERFPALRVELLNEQGELHGHVHFFINGRDVPRLENVLDTQIGPEDTINIFPAVGGGSGRLG